LLMAHPGLLAYPNSEGGIKAFRALTHALAAGSHQCEVVTIPPRGGVKAAPDWSGLCSVGPVHDRPAIRFTLTDELPITDVRSGKGNMLSRLRNGLRVRREYGDLVRTRVREWRPDWVLWEVGVGNLGLAYSVAGERLVPYVGSTTLLPFGPLAGRPHRVSRGHPLMKASKIVCVSEFIRRYLRQHAQLESAVQHNVAYGRAPYPLLGQFDGGVVTLVNTSRLKGVSVFLELARRFPLQRFRAVRSWGVVPPELGALPNVELVEPSDDINAVLRDTKVLLVPSMWGEAWGMICIDAMLRGIPVLASDDGGLPEATLGVGRCVPIEPIRFGRRFLAGPRRPEWPVVDMSPWVEQLEQLLVDRSHWARRSQAGRDAALAHVSGLSVEPLTSYLSAP
jgi:glycosyltransferase involved in cell wall biosynthesis